MRKRRDANGKRPSSRERQPRAEQVALVPPGPPPEDVLSSLDALRDAQSVFKELAALDWAFTAHETSYLSHDLHPYPAKFIPQIPRALIGRLSLRGESVWDPFGGSGTTALEAILLGRRALSTDANPLGVVIGRAKTLTLAKEEEDVIRDLLEELDVLIADAVNVQDALARQATAAARYVPDAPNLAEWFHPNAVSELAHLRWRIENLEFERSRVLATMTFSRIVLRASYQDAETRYARRVRDLAPGDVLRMFSVELEDALARVRRLAPLLRFRRADFRTADLRDPELVSPAGLLPPESVDLIVTSPPYPNATDYHLYHRFRLFWLGHDPRAFGKQEIGSHLRHQKERSGFEQYLGEMRPCLENMFRALRPGRYAALVLGDALFGGTTYPTAKLVADQAAGLGFEYVGIIDRPVHATRRSFIAPARRARDEQILVLRKPPRSLKVTLVKPPYKPWPYEQDLRTREVEALLGVEPAPSPEGHLRIEVEPYAVDRLRRLTFTHGFHAEGHSREPTWQAILENGTDPPSRSSRKDPKYVTHGIHAYKGKFYPQLAKSLFNLACLRPGRHVLDPFCGSGTVLLEAHLNGLRATGLDLNPLAVKIARVKTSILDVDPYLLNRLLGKFQARLERMQAAPEALARFPEGVRSELEAWFPRPVLYKLGWLLDEIDQVPEPHVRELLEVLTSSIVREVSHQEPRDLRIRRRREVLSDAPVGELMHGRLAEQRSRLQRFAERMDRAPCVFLPISASCGDSRDPAVLRAAGIAKGSVDAVVTSPPYATALPYIDTDRLSLLLLLGLPTSERSVLERALTGSREISRGDRIALEARIDADDFASIPSATAQRIVTEVRRKNLGSAAGFRRQNMAALLYRYFADMAAVMRNLDDALAPGASAFFVIGDNRTEAGGQVVRISNAQVFREVADSLGWTTERTVPITVTKEDFAHNRNAITRNDILWFKRP